MKCLDEAELILAGDLARPESEREGEIAAAIAVKGLEDMSAHFRPCRSRRDR